MNRLNSCGQELERELQKCRDGLVEEVRQIAGALEQGADLGDVTRATAAHVFEIELTRPHTGPEVQICLDVDGRGAWFSRGGAPLPAGRYRALVLFHKLSDEAP